MGVRRKRFRWFHLAFLLLVVLVSNRLRHPLPTPESFPFDQTDSFLVQRVVDGDTLLLANRARVRLIGVDTPEIGNADREPEPYALEASEFTRQMVEGRHVRLTFDRERKDTYGRILAYMYLDETLLNEEILRAGWGRSLTRFPYSRLMKKRFLAAENEARSAGRGLHQNTQKRLPPNSKRPFQ